METDIYSCSGQYSTFCPASLPSVELRLNAPASCRKPRRPWAPYRYQMDSSIQEEGCKILSHFTVLSCDRDHLLTSHLVLLIGWSCHRFLGRGWWKRKSLYYKSGGCGCKLEWINDSQVVSAIYLSNDGRYCCRIYGAGSGASDVTIGRGEAGQPWSFTLEEYSGQVCSWSLPGL